MRISQVSDLNISDALASNFDLAIFASGYESRCVALAERMEGIPQQVVALGFANSRNPDRRAIHDHIFSKKFGVVPICISGSDDFAIYDILTTELDGNRWLGKNPIAVLVDYSSMTRTWYAAILNWFRFSKKFKSVSITFCYTAGVYTGEVFKPLSVKEVVALPGFEGRSATLHKSIAIFGLGFEALVPLSLLDKLQPDAIYSIVAVNEKNEKYLERAIEVNHEILAISIDRLFLPLNSVTNSLTRLAEFLVPFQGDSDITYIPVGPKPHVLVGLLLSQQFEDVTMLHIRGDSISAEDVVPSGDFVVTKVVLAN